MGWKFSLKNFSLRWSDVDLIRSTIPILIETELGNFNFFQNISNVMMGKRTSRISGILRISRIRLLLGITKISGKLRISDILTLFVPTLLDSSRVWGGQISPPLNYCHDMTILIFFFDRVLCLGCTRSESKSTAHYLKNCSPEIFKGN